MNDRLLRLYAMRELRQVHVELETNRKVGTGQARSRRRTLEKQEPLSRVRVDDRPPLGFPIRAGQVYVSWRGAYRTGPFQKWHAAEAMSHGTSRMIQQQKRR